MVYLKSEVSEPSDPAPALTRGIEILKLLEGEGALALEAITQKTGWPKSSVSRIMQSLVYVGVVRRDASTLEYLATYRLIPFASSETDLRQYCSDELLHLARTCEQTAELYVLEDERIVMLDRCEPENQELCVRARIGTTRDLNDAEALTLTAMAFSIEEGKWPTGPLWYWESGKKKKITGRKLVGALHQIRDSLEAKDFEFNPNGVRRYVAPIFDAEMKMVAMLAVAQVYRPDAEEVSEKIMNAVRDSAEALTGGLSGPAILNEEDHYQL